MFKQVLLKASSCFFLFFCLLIFPSMAEENTGGFPVSIQRCETDPNSFEEICKELYIQPSIVCSTVDECVEMVGQQVSELREIHKYLKSCEADKECQKTCNKIYSHSTRSIDNCMRFSWMQVRRIKQIYESLKNPTEENLKSIHVKDFRNFVHIDPHPLQMLFEELPIPDAITVLVKLMIKYPYFSFIWTLFENRHFMKTLIEGLDFFSAKELLAHIAKNRHLAVIFYRNDEDHQLLPSLLIRVDEDVRAALSMDISNEEEERFHFSFMQEAIEKNNEHALKWVHDFFTERCKLVSKTSSEENFCVFRHWYCKVSPTDNEYWESPVHYVHFRNIVNGILSEHTTDSPPWQWDMKTVNGLHGEHLKSICKINLLPIGGHTTNSYVNGVKVNISPITEISEGQIVYYAGLGEYQKVEALQQFWHPEGHPCNVQFGAELTALGWHEDGESIWVEITDKELHEEERNLLCTRNSRFFAPKERLSQTQPGFLSFDYLADYSVEQADDFSKGDIIYCSEAQDPVSYDIPVKNALYLFDPDHHFYTDRCVIKSEYHQCQILGFSQDEKFVLLEVYNEDTKENDCKKGVQFIKRKRDISKTPPTH